MRAENLATPQPRDGSLSLQRMYVSAAHVCTLCTCYVQHVLSGPGPVPSLTYKPPAKAPSLVQLPCTCMKWPPRKEPEHHSNTTTAISLTGVWEAISS